MSYEIIKKFDIYLNVFVKLWNDSAGQWEPVEEGQALFLVRLNPENWMTEEVKKLNDHYRTLLNHPDPLHGTTRYKTKPRI